MLFVSHRSRSVWSAVRKIKIGVDGVVTLVEADPFLVGAFIILGQNKRLSLMTLLLSTSILYGTLKTNRQNVYDEVIHSA